MRNKNRFHGLKKIKVRATWNKYNLYNLSRLRDQRTNVRTFFQQKWSAKSISRAYHGEYIREKQWQTMFRPFAPAVVPLDAKELAVHDGSEQAEGRGSGKDPDPRFRQRIQEPIPYMGMVYGPIERRLDTAIFRALFASSARQARQFVIHGSVRVNGKRMIYPGYLLNPGDMFQVDPDKVMYATGVQKELVRKKTRRAFALERKRESEAKRARAAKEAVLAEAERAINEESESGSQPEVKAVPETPADGPSKQELRRKRKEATDTIKTILAKGKKTLSPKRKQTLRAAIGEVVDIYHKKPPAEIDGALKALLKRVTEPGDLGLKSSDRESSSTDRGADKVTKEEGDEKSNDSYRTADEREQLKAILEELEAARENPIDHRKPYATPWQPRPWMAPFAFIPRYLEVNQKICAAVYLRHPVARPGLAEVPSPFGMETNQLAFNWYLRRR